MGGYNTYCEILSFDKPALIVPRLQPREEQLIRGPGVPPHLGSSTCCFRRKRRSLAPCRGPEGTAAARTAVAPRPMA